MATLLQPQFVFIYIYLLFQAVVTIYINVPGNSFPLKKRALFLGHQL